MKKSDILKLAEFTGNKNLKEYSGGRIMFTDKFGIFREWLPDENIEDAEMLIDRLKENKIWHALIVYHTEYIFMTTKLIVIHNKSKCLAICNAVLKLINEGK